MTGTLRTVSRTHSLRGAPILLGGSLLAATTLLVPGYWRTDWWALGCTIALCVGPGVGCILVARLGIAPGALIPVMLLADAMVVLAAPCVAEQPYRGATIVLFALPTVIGSLFGRVRTLVVQAVAVALGSAAILRMSAEATPALVFQSLLAVFGTISPAGVVMALRRHLDSAVQAERALAVTDQLTATANRRGMEAAADRLAALAARRDLPVGVLVADIDHFKRINDDHGHPVGDQVLRRVAATMHACIRTEDQLVRLGGEEFAVLAIMGPTALTGLAERLREQVAERCHPWALTISVGVAWGDLEHSPGHSLVDRLWSVVNEADAVLLRAKKTGRNRVCVAQPAAGAQVDLTDPALDLPSTRSYS